MIKDLIRIADFLDKSGKQKDANLIDYISQKYAGGDLKGWMKEGYHRDFLDTEFGKTNFKKSSYIKEEIPDEEKEETEELLNSLMESLSE